MEELRRGIRERGGIFLDDEAKGYIRNSDQVIHVKTAKGERLKADQFVLAGGAWTPEMTHQLGLRLPMQGGKGYSLTLKKPAELPRLCSLLKEARVAVTPMGGKLRVGGTMEICGTDLSVSRKRVQGIIESFCKFFPAFKATDFEGIKPWSGLRPCTPDGLPCIGSFPGLQNVTVATGHAMLGLSLGPVTGQLVTDLITQSKTDLDIDLGRLLPDRF
jgi:D-amino-acid dehydrogenase